MKTLQRTIFSLLFFILGSGTILAQWYNPDADSTKYFESRVQVASSRHAEQNFERARSDLENGEFERGVRLIQENIDDHGAKALSTDSGHFVGIHEYCNDFLRSLPAEGREVYRSIFDPYAKELFERGCADHDSVILHDVFYRYQETSYGKKSLIAAMAMELEQAKLHSVIWSALLYRDTYGDDSDAGPVLVGFITAAKLLDDLDRLEDLKARLGPEVANKPVLVAGYPSTVGKLLNGAISELQSHSRETKMRPSPKAELFKEERWVFNYDMALGPRDSGSRMVDFGEDVSANELPWHPVQPVMDSSSVYLTNGVSVTCLELYSRELRWTTEGRSWVKKTQARPDRYVTYPLTLSNNVVFTALETELPTERTIWTFTPQLAISHRQLIALDATDGRVIWQHFRYRGKTAEETEFVAGLNINSNPLVIGDQIYVAASRFHTSYHQYLCCFDRHDGQLLWSTFICTGQMEQNMFGNRVREAVSGELIEKDGIIFHSTNLGMIAAVDARLGTLKFTVEYPQIQIPRQTRFDNRIHERAPGWNNQKPILVGDRAFFTPIDSQSVVAVNIKTGATIDTGLERTRFNRYRYLVGPWKNWIVACGARIAFYNTQTGETIEPSYGFANSRRDSTVLSSGLIGQPLVMNGRLFAPVFMRSAEKMIIWDIEDQRIIDEQPLPRGRDLEVLGNLSESDGIVLIAGTNRQGTKTEVRAYFDRARVRSALELAVAQTPGDPGPHFRLAEFALQGERKDYLLALTSFEKAYKLAEAEGISAEIWSRRASDALYRLYREVAESPRIASEALKIDVETAYERAFAVADEPIKKAEILFLLLGRAFDTRNSAAFDRNLDRLVNDFESTPYDYRNLFRNQVPELRPGRYDSAAMVATLLAATFDVKRGKPAEGVSHYQELLARWPRELIGGQTVWQYAFDQIEDLKKKIGIDVYAGEEAAAQQLFTSGTSGGGFRQLQRILDNYPNSAVVTQAYRAISRAQIDSGDVEGAIHGIQEFLSRFGQVTGEPLALLAEALERQGMQDSAAQIWQRIASLGAHEIDDAALLDRAKEAIGKLDSRTESSKASPSLSLNPSITWSLGDKDAPGEWSLIVPQGRRPETATDILLTQKLREFAAYSIKSGKKLWHMDAVDSINSAQAFWFDNRLIAIIDESVVVLDPETGREHWRYRSESLELSGLCVGQGKVYLLLEKSGFPTDFNLQTRSLLDGSFIAERVIEGVARSQGMKMGDRYLLIPLENRLATLVIDGLSLQAAPAWPDGLEASDVMEPYFAPDGHVVSITLGSDRSEQEIIAHDPQNGRTKWRRKVGDGIARFYLDQSPEFLIYRLRPSSSSETIVVVDSLKGTAEFKRSLTKGVDLADVPVVMGGDLFAVQKDMTRRVSVYAECYSMKTGSTLWRSTNFTGRTLIVRAHPFAEGVILRVIEDMRGMREGRWNTKLYFVDRKSGRVENEITLETKSSSRVGEISFMAGHLVISDGALLKVYGP